MMHQCLTESAVQCCRGVLGCELPEVHLVVLLLLINENGDLQSHGKSLDLLVDFICYRYERKKFATLP